MPLYSKLHLLPGASPGLSTAGPRCSHACCLHPADAPTHPTLLLMQNLSPKDILLEVAYTYGVIGQER